MNSGLVVAKGESTRDRSIAKVVSIQFIPLKKISDKLKASIQEEATLFYTKPIFKAKKFELF